MSGKPLVLSVAESFDTLVLRAMIAAIELAIIFKPVTNDAAPAMLAHWSQGMDRAFKAVVGVGLATYRDLESFVVVISTRLALAMSLTPDLDNRQAVNNSCVGMFPTCRLKRLHLRFIHRKLTLSRPCGITALP